MTTSVQSLFLGSSKRFFEAAQLSLQLKVKEVSADEQVSPMD